MIMTMIRVIVIMTMIRVIKTNHDLDPKCSLLVTNVFGVSMTFFIVFLSSCCGFMAFLANLSVF